MPQGLVLNLVLFNDFISDLDEVVAVANSLNLQVTPIGKGSKHTRRGNSEI